MQFGLNWIRNSTGTPFGCAGAAQQTVFQHTKAADGLTFSQLDPIGDPTDIPYVSTLFGKMILSGNLAWRTGNIYHF